MFKAKKENKIYNINESQIKEYLDQGYDIYKDGELYKRSPKTKVTYAEYEKVVKENEMLKEEIEKLKAELGSQKKGSVDEFSVMSTDELKAYAEEHNINIGNASSQKGIADKIRAALKSE